LYFLIGFVFDRCPKGYTGDTCDQVLAQIIDNIEQVANLQDILIIVIVLACAALLAAFVALGMICSIKRSKEVINVSTSSSLLDVIWRNMQKIPEICLIIYVSISSQAAPNMPTQNVEMVHVQPKTTFLQIPKNSLYL